MDNSVTSLPGLPGRPSVEAILLACNRAVARATNEQDALQLVCDLVVDNGLFRGASIGFSMAGKHKGSLSNHCFLLNADGVELGALTVSSGDPAAFTAPLVEALTEWCESFSLILAATRRRALHGRTNADAEAGSDLDERKRTETALRRSEAFLTKTQRLSTTGSFLWTTSTGSIVWSDETFRIFAYASDGTTLTLDHLFRRVHREEVAQARALFETAKRDGEGFEAELRLLMPDDSTKQIRIVLQAIGCPTTGEFVGAIMDITAAKEMAQALAFRDQVMGILGHDLRNPLGAVYGVVGLARLDQGLSATLRDHFTQIDLAARRMHEMIETLLDFTQTRFAGRLPISPAPTNLGELCGRVVGELAAGHPRRTIDLEAHGDANGTWDPGRIAQVVSNLVGNALTHGDPGAPVHLSVEGEPRAVTLKVHNLGPAIVPEQIPVLFEPFRRGATSEGTSVSRGLGLGLHIAKQIVIAHGGSISVQSSAAEGTTFCVGLPRELDHHASL
jgi:signal transduction histidine kinase